MSENIYHTIKADDKRFFINCIITAGKNDHRPYMSCVAKDTYAQCIADNGKWMIDVLHEEKKYGADENLIYLCDFCNYYLNAALSGSQKDTEIKLLIMSASIDFMEYLYHELKTDRCKGELPVSYEKAAKIYETLSGRNNLEQALKLCQKGLKISEQLEELS